LKNMTIEETRELAELTDRIAANLEKISDDQNNLDILEEQTSRVAGNLQAINEDENNLDMLEEQTMRIVRNLELIVKASPGQ
jgi:uncharacterized protein involved in exopolysaccharide biosynthesis